MIRKQLIALLALGVTCAVWPQHCRAADDGVSWQVGACDNDYAEFGIAGRFQKYAEEFLDGVTFEIGKGNPAEDWPFIHPGPDDLWAGRRDHPHEIVFHLDRRPDNPFLIRIDLVDVHATFPSTLRVRVNEAVGSYDLGRGVSDLSLTRADSGSEQVVEMYVTESSLRKGRNVVGLTVTKGAWLLYDCISMRSVEAIPALAGSLALQPTFLFKQRGKTLKQIVNARIELHQPQDVVRIRLASEKGWQVEQVFENLTNGRHGLALEVPPVKTAHKVRLTAFVGPEVHETEATIQPQKRWKIYLLPSTHFDHGYTSIQHEALRVNRENTDRAMDWCRDFPDFIWNLEVSFTAEDYLRQGSHSDDFLQLARQGRLGVQGLYGNQLTGICSSEELSRLLDYYDLLRHRYGIESACAMQTDVPTMVATVPMILRGHGIKYLSHGINYTRAGSGQELHCTPFYWESPDGSKVLMWKARGYAQSSRITGTADRGDIELAKDRISGLLSEYVGRADYPYDAVLLHGAYADNRPSGGSLAAVPAEWNRTYAYPRLVHCRGPEFFEYIEANFGAYIPTIRGDGGVYWEDGAASSALETAKTRVAKENLLTAEKLAALCDVRFQRKLRRDLAAAWKNVLLYDEHTWGAAGSIRDPFSKETLGQWAVKKSFADDAAWLARVVLDKASSEFFSGIRASEDSVAVFNPSGWTRSERIEFTGADGERRSLFADSVPGLGYKVFRLDRVDTNAEADAAGDTLDNRYYTIKFDPATGAVASIYDKELKRELVDSSAYGLNAYLYVGGGEGSALLRPGRDGPQLTVEMCANASFQRLTLPGRHIMRIVCDAPMARSLTSEVILHDEQKRIDFVNSLDKVANLGKEGGYFAFPFAFASPSTRLEIPDGVIRPEVDQLPGACRDWHAIQHFLTLSDDSAAVVWTPIDSPLVTLQDINRGQWYHHLSIENGNVFAYVFNNYWYTNYKAAQEGPLTFRFAVTSGKSISDAEAKRFGESVHSPMICRPVTSDGDTREGSRSLVEVRRHDVVLQALMPARFAGGTVIRLREMSGRDAKARIIPRGIDFQRAYLCNLAEDKQHRLPVRNGAIDVPCRALGLATVLLER